uniref:FERM domain containing 4Ba n=1 Tax=Salarias fasciatus TaxID=181472 RepID=A0A672ID09_SALFA
SVFSKMTTTRSTGDIAMDLTEISAPRITKLSSIDNKDQLIMASNGSLISAGSADSEVSDEQKKEKIDSLTKKLEELKKICMREAELTGKLPKEYPLATGEKAPQIRRRVGTAFKLDDLFPDPHLRNLESRFALQQKIVEAAMKLANEGDLCKTVKRKEEEQLPGRNEEAGRDRERDQHFFPFQMMPTLQTSALCLDSLTLDDGTFTQGRQRSRSVQYSPRLHHADTLDIHYNRDRRCSANDQPVERSQSRIPATHLLPPFKPASRQPRDARSMPPTPLLTRNAYSSTQLRRRSQHFRQRSGSLESQSQFVTETQPPAPAFAVSWTTARPTPASPAWSTARRGTTPTGAAVRGRRKDLYANTGSMPNLAQADARSYAYQPRPRPTTTAYYVTGYPAYAEPEPYSNGVYGYDNETEGHYSVNAAYYTPQAAYHAHDVHAHYGHDEMDGMSQNPYATLRPPRNRPAPRETVGLQLRLRPGLPAEPGLPDAAHALQEHVRLLLRSQQPRCFTMLWLHALLPLFTSSSLFRPAVSSMSSGNWHSHMTVVSRSPRSASSSPNARQLLCVYSRSYVDVGQMDSHVGHQMHANMEPEEQIYWHEDSKPGTIV